LRCSNTEEVLNEVFDTLFVGLRRDALILSIILCIYVSYHCQKNKNCSATWHSV